MDTQKSLHCLGISQNLAKHYCRAKFLPAPDGGMVLASVQMMSRPVFGESGLEECAPKPHCIREEWEIPNEDTAAENFMRSARRAKVGAFDAIMCNRDLDTFATFTYSPDCIGDKTSYSECYNVLKPWLSNRVQRKGLKYIVCPEYHKSGAIHFHMIANSSALSLERARNANTGRLLYHNKNPLFNVVDWYAGFTSAEIIRAGEGDRIAVAKYIFKYMGKQMGQKIGGRFFLHGGEMEQPAFIYADSPHELADLRAAKSFRECSGIGGYDGLFFKEWSFL